VFGIQYVTNYWVCGVHTVVILEERFAVALGVYSCMGCLKAGEHLFCLCQDTHLTEQ